MKNKIKYIVPIFLIISILTIIGINQTKKSPIKQDKAIYQIKFYDEGIPGSNYDISIYNDRIELDAIHYCSAADCEPTEKPTEIKKYKTENIEKLKEFFKNNLKMQEYEMKEVRLPELTEYEQDVLTSLYLNEFIFEICVETYQYKFSYTKNNNTEYNFYFKEDKTIIAKTVHTDNLDEITKIDTHQINFNQENTQKLFNYAKIITEENHGYSYHKSGPLYKDEKNIYLSLTENDETYLNESEVNLLYEFK